MCFLLAVTLDALGNSSNPTRRRFLLWRNISVPFGLRRFEELPARDENVEAVGNRSAQGPGCRA
jgi:hypothetical protein